jgi:hypothetical protein
LSSFLFLGWYFFFSSFEQNLSVPFCSSISNLRHYKYFIP